MQVIINTDHNVNLTEESIGVMESLVESTLGHFDSHLTRVEVHLSDESAFGRLDQHKGASSMGGIEPR